MPTRARRPSCDRGDYSGSAFPRPASLSPRPAKRCPQESVACRALFTVAFGFLRTKCSRFKIDATLVRSSLDASFLGRTRVPTQETGCRSVGPPPPWIDLRYML